ncbi:hypothetical protein UFOVP813_37 [uncultured Caudovirales phage]|uniref:Uncharacterized protein n=1 Tax=uncultured Caudovirales phage TaxID=2100421 RepID=A0A6J5P2P2_9CAUD|nr:hypothetical protein UFOVP813_37 [uncultured Caudovirales phage]
MTPYEQAAGLYADEASFQADLLPHLVSGYVIANPSLFILFRPVLSTASPADIANPWKQFDKPDAWYVWLMAGKARELYQYMPYPLPLLGFARFNQPARFHPLERFKELACIRRS